MKNGNALYKSSKFPRKKIKNSPGKIKSTDNKCPSGWYCYGPSCTECIPEHVKIEENLPKVFNDL